MATMNKWNLNLNTIAFTSTTKNKMKIYKSNRNMPDLHEENYKTDGKIKEFTVTC